MATTKNIAITINNGLDYDTLYPTCNLANYIGTLPITATSGTLPISRGGTNSVSAGGSLYNLINGATALASTNLATGDYIGIGDVSASTGKKVTLTNLATYLSTIMSSGSEVKEAHGYYTGTGTFSTSYNYTFSIGFIPNIFIIATDSASYAGLSTFINSYGNAPGEAIFFPLQTGSGSMVYTVKWVNASKTYLLYLDFVWGSTDLSFSVFDDSSDSTASDSIKAEGIFNYRNTQYNWLALSFT